MSCEHVYSFLMPQDSRHPDSLADKYFSIKSPKVASMSEGDKFGLKLIHHNGCCMVCFNFKMKFPILVFKSPMSTPPTVWIFDHKKF